MINLDEFERRLRTAGSRSPQGDDPLVELARLVDGTAPQTRVASSPPRTGVKDAPAKPSVCDASDASPSSRALDLHPAEMESEPLLEDAALRQAFDGNENAADAGEPVDDLGPQDAPVAAVHGFREQSEPPRASFRWKASVAALALAGVAMFGGAVALRSGAVPGLSKSPPFIAAAQGPTRVQPPSEQAASASADPGSNLLKDATPPAKVKVVTSQEQPVDLAAEAKAEAPAPAAASPAPSAPGSDAIRGTTDTPVVVASANPAAAMVSQFPDPKPVRTVSLRPDGTPIAASATPPPDPVPAAAPAPAAAKPAQKASGSIATAQPSTPKIDLPIKSSKSSARVVVAKTDTTGPSEGEALPTKIDKTARAAKAERVASAEPTAPQAAEPAPATSGAWAVQLGAPKSEEEAKSALAKLNTKYGSALGGSPLGVHKAVVNGETIYRLRVTGLSKADAAALCARLKGEGGDCFIAK